MNTDDDDEGFEGATTCWMCGGEGAIVVCMDDMCRGTNACIHGDGEDVCPNCLGEGVL